MIPHRCDRHGSTDSPLVINLINISDYLKLFKLIFALEKDISYSFYIISASLEEV